MKKHALLGVAFIAGMILSTSVPQPANAQLADILKNALGGQLAGSNFNDPYNNPAYNGYNNYNYNDFNNYDGTLNGSGSGLSGLLGQLIPGQTSQFADPTSQSYLYNTPSTGNSLVDSLLPLVQNGGVGSNLLGSYLPQSQLSSAYGGYLNPGYQNFGGTQPVVFNGVSLDSSIYSGPYKGTPHQVESAMNLDWQMTVLREQIGLGAAQGYLMSADANMFDAQLSNLVSQKQRVVRRNGLSFNDSQILVRQLNDLVNRVRQAWYNPSFNGNNNRYSYGRRGRFARSNAYGQVLNPARNETLDRLYLMTQPSAGFRR